MKEVSESWWLNKEEKRMVCQLFSSDEPNRTAILFGMIKMTTLIR